MRQRKPSCYLEKRCTGWWMLEPVIDWIAFDNWQHEIARAKTKKECERKARLAGYTPR